MTLDPVTVTRRPFDPAKHCGARRISDDEPGPHMSQGKLRLREGGGKGEPCRQWKGWGTEHRGWGHCRTHQGNTPNHEAQAAREAATAALASLGIQVRSDPAQALLEQVWEASGNVAFLRAGVQALGRAVALGGTPHVLTRMYGEERDRLARISKLALDAGIAERAITLAELQADAIVVVVTRVLDSLELPRAQRDAAQLVAVSALREMAEVEVSLPAGSKN